MKKTFRLGFVNESTSDQDWSLYLDQTSIPTFTLKAGKGSSKYVPVELDDGENVQINVTANNIATAKLTKNGDSLVLTSDTPNEWNLNQETGDQYVVNCKVE